jgi:hypothetical protein
MLDCLIDSVGIYYCEGAEAPESGLYINSLPGISVESIDHTADSEQVTFLGVWADVQSNAVNQLFRDIRTEIKKCFELNSQCNYEDLICENAEVFYDSWRYLLGTWLMIFRLTSPRLNWWTTIAREDAEKLQALYRSEYESGLKQSVQLMNIDNCCMVCSPTPKRVTWLP